jgi:NAD(P)-dependent dehydrogenase (short-subunit alcohol dehydrogenase family)
VSAKNRRPTILTLVQKPGQGHDRSMSDPVPRPTAIVTGGTSGIGAGIARALAAAGHSVLACGLPRADGVEPPAVDGVRTVPLDVTDPASVARLFDGIERLDLLVNCAGIIRRGGAEFDPDVFARTLDVNLTGTMRLCVAAHPALKAAGGAIVNTASMLSFHGSAFVPGYAASKGGVAQLTKSLAAAWAADGIRVNAVAPGWIETDLTRPLVEDPARSAPILARTPQGRWGTPDDVAGVVLVLASDAARFVTGAVVPVDGGYLAV